jgi:SOS-response transcriptional repressor LexA
MLPIAKTGRHVPAPGNMLTPTQADVLIFAWEFYRANDQLPTRREVCKRFGFASWNSAQTHIEALERKGWLERNACGKFKFGRVARAHMEQAEYADACREAGIILESAPA